MTPAGREPAVRDNLAHGQATVKAAGPHCVAHHGRRDSRFRIRVSNTLRISPVISGA